MTPAALTELHRAEAISYLHSLYYQHHNGNAVNFPKKYIPKPDYNLTKTNDIERAIKNTIEWNGYRVIPTKMNSRQIMTKKGLVWVSNGTKYRGDLTAFIPPNLIHIELKNKYTHDRMSDGQERFRDNIKNNEIYITVNSYESFYEWFKINVLDR
jgi:hypothetical protein